MQDILLNAIKQQIHYMESNKAPEGLKSEHMQLLDILLKAKAGDMQGLLEIKDKLHKLHEMFRNPNIRTRESATANKLVLAEKDDTYRSAVQDTTLQESLNAAMDAVIEPALKSVIYMAKVLGPVTALMGDSGDQG